VKWFDDVISSAATPGSQVVLLGAGLDTRPYRLDLPADVDWFELDRPEVFAAKEPALAGQGASCRRHTVIGDVSQEWPEPPRARRFRPRPADLLGGRASAREKAGAPPPPPYGHDDPVALFEAGGWGAVRATPPGARPGPTSGDSWACPRACAPGHAARACAPGERITVVSGRTAARMRIRILGSGSRDRPGGAST
jgi:Leucine carboxyl methyltransferase